MDRAATQAWRPCDSLTSIFISIGTNGEAYRLKALKGAFTGFSRKKSSRGGA